MILILSSSQKFYTMVNCLQAIILVFVVDISSLFRKILPGVNSLTILDKWEGVLIANWDFHSDMHRHIVKKFDLKLVISSVDGTFSTKLYINCLKERNTKGGFNLGSIEISFLFISGFSFFLNDPNYKNFAFSWWKICFYILYCSRSVHS